MRKQEFYFDLPKELIAQTPLKDRSSSRLLILDKENGDIRHGKFTDIKNMINKGDCIVINDTKVLPARLIGERKNTGARVEVLLLKRMEDNRWEVLVYPGKKAKIGNVISFGGGKLECEVEKITEGGNRIVRFDYEGIFEEILDELGQMPLPPYITEKLEDKTRYQTVYAKYDGSAAAPTAGLHFTKELLEELREKGVNIACVTLHVGLGTFRPVKCDEITEHQMHSEYFNIESEQAKIINDTKKNGGKIIAVGTTSTRTLESAADENGYIEAKNGQTDIFIYPGYKFKVIDSLITNFHLPESTLIMLVSALAGKDNVMKAYREAVEERYRFFSFGDAMFIKG
ncbi:MAG: tRNA preQ1(34) S-adenosylmethionine ribosyltransferase-isomerase QueA [Firmicutes bacterium]|nr:tRNA preQ1(34) S-adenosylmethionine ribosyltransferase-isomerase QueA [Bacillota bacterium]